MRKVFRISPWVAIGDAQAHQAESDGWNLRAVAAQFASRNGN